MAYQHLSRVFQWSKIMMQHRNFLTVREFEFPPIISSGTFQMHFSLTHQLKIYLNHIVQRVECHF